MIEVPKPRELGRRGGVWLRSGDVFIHLGCDRDFRAATKAHPALRCADYETLVRRLESRGIAVLTDERLVEGKPHCYIADPFGNRIELIKDC